MRVLRTSALILTSLVLTAGCGSTVQTRGTATSIDTSIQDGLSPTDTQSSATDSSHPQAIPGQRQHA